LRKKNLFYTFFNTWRARKTTPENPLSTNQKNGVQNVKIFYPKFLQQKMWTFLLKNDDLR